MAAKPNSMRALGTLLVALLFAAACGPVEYMNQVSRVASSEVEAAKAVNADKHAPYYYTLAVEYLHKAREEAAHSDYQSANRFGKRSAEAARKARALALQNAKNPKPKLPALEAEDEELEFVDPGEEGDESGTQSGTPSGTSDEDSDNPIGKKR